MNRRQFIAAAGVAVPVALAGCGSDDNETVTGPYDGQTETARLTTTASEPTQEPTASVPTRATTTPLTASKTAPATATPTSTPTATQMTSTTGDEPEILVRGSGSTDIVVPVGETQTGAITLTRILNGLDGYKVTVTTADTDICTFTTVTVPGRYSGVLDESVSDDGATATCAVLDAGVEGEQTDVLLGRVEISGTAPGKTSLQVDSGGFVDEDGERVSPTGRDGTVTVTES